MVTVLDLLGDVTVHQVIELLLREPNQEKKMADWFNDFMYKLDTDKDLIAANGDENQISFL